MEDSNNGKNNVASNIKDDPSVTLTIRLIMQGKVRLIILDSSINLTKLHSFCHKFDTSSRNKKKTEC